jgi:twitching motility protein PilU
MSSETQSGDAQAGLRSLLEHMLRIKASELYLSAGSPPVFRVQDVPYPGRVALGAAEIGAMADAVLSAAQRAELAAALELNLVLALGAEQRFCVNVFFQRRAPGMVVRALPARVRTFGELGLPSALAELAFERGGLVLVAGERRSGKSSTLAALIEHRNATAPGHILTIEDPIELLHEPKQCVVTQREIGVDTRSYIDALRNAPRQAPDLLMIDAIRAGDVLDSTLALAAAGQLCLSSLHARGAVHAIERLLDFVAPSHHAELRARLASCLCAVIAQRLVATDDGKRVVVLEVLRSTALVKDLLRHGDRNELGALQQALTPGADGASSFDDGLAALVQAERISPERALAAADDARALERRLSEAGHKEAQRSFEPIALRFAPELPDGPRPEAPRPEAPRPAKPAAR